MANKFDSLFADIPMASQPGAKQDKPVARPERFAHLFADLPNAPQWRDLPGNIPGSALNAAKGIVEAVRNYPQTIDTLDKAATGAMLKGQDYLRSKLPAPVVGALDAADAVAKPFLPGPMGNAARNPEYAQQSRDVAGEIGQGYSDRYGSFADMKRTAIQDPVGVMMDVSTVAAGGAGALGKVPLAAAQAASKGLRTAATVTNPLNAVTKPIASASRAMRETIVTKSLDELRVAKNAAYGELRKIDARYTPKAMDGLVRNIARGFDRQGFKPELHDKVAAYIPELEQLRTSALTPDELDGFRQRVYRDMVEGQPRADAHFGRQIIAKIDQFTENAPYTAMTFPNGKPPPNIGQMLREARAANRRYRQTETIHAALSRGEDVAAATGTGANTDNALRQKMVALKHNRKGAEYKRLSPEAQAQVNRIIYGDVARNTGRALGKYAPSGVVSGGIGASMGAAAGGAIAGPAGAKAGAFIVPGVGYLSKKLADASTRQEVQRLIQIVQNDGRAIEGPRRAAPDTASALWMLAQLSGGQ